MNLRLVGTSLLITVTGILAFSSSLPAAPPWQALIPFRKVEADPKKSYYLTEEHGPWLILASTFAGEGAEQQARDLVLELREQFNLPAFLHRKHYDYTQPVDGIPILDRYGNVKRMRYEHAAEFDQFAVLVGHFDSIEDPAIDKVLDKIRYARPKTLEIAPGKQTTQRLAVFREIQRKLSPEADQRERGPMGKAFVTRNPLLPEEYFTGNGIDDLVLKMNSDLEYSLLKNPARYTVRIATFRGAVTMNLKEIEEYERTGKVSNKLEQAAINAHEMTKTLRKKGIEAYEFHDRYESIVTVGGFDSLGTPRADGKVDLQPAIVQIIDQFKARQVDLPGGGTDGLQPVRVNGIACDVQPWPVMVPRQSIATDYAHNRKFLP